MHVSDNANVLCVPKSTLKNLSNGTKFFTHISPGYEWKLKCHFLSR